jgi:hypothetical protein
VCHCWQARRQIVEGSQIPAAVACGVLRGASLQRWFCDGAKRFEISIARNDKYNRGAFQGMLRFFKNVLADLWSEVDLHGLARSDCVPALIPHDPTSGSHKIALKLPYRGTTVPGPALAGTWLPNDAWMHCYWRCSRRQGKSPGDATKQSHRLWRRKKRSLGSRSSSLIVSSMKPSLPRCRLKSACMSPGT